MQTAYEETIDDPTRRADLRPRDESLSAARELPSILRSLARVHRNYWWSWAGEGAGVFRDLCPETWERTEHNPLRLLREVPDFRLTQMAVDPAYTRRVANLAREFDEYMKPEAKTWATSDASVRKVVTPQRPVAYFCAEYGIHNSLPLYSGGLGMLAGDHLKSASDLGLPLVGIGLLYRYGYFRQQISAAGWQEENYGEVPPGDLPIDHVMDDAGDPLTVSVEMRGRTVHAYVWRAQVGRVPLYLLDTNVEANTHEEDRWITGHLYGGDRETRIVQELMLGVGGVRALRRLGIEPHVYHLNEGHSAFLTLELARELVQGAGDAKTMSFADAREKVRERCVFTTHTPVAAGNDEFAPGLIDRCLGESYWSSLDISREEFLSVGRVRPEDASEGFGMTPLAIRMCRSTNGVSRKHGEVSRSLWQGMFGAKSMDDVPITSVTNGVHAPTWIAPAMRELFERYVGTDWTDAINDQKRWSEGVAKITDAELWERHELLKQRLVAFIRHRTYHSRAGQGESYEYTESARTMFDPHALIIGFARRIAAYKRWNLLLSDAERLRRMIADESRPVQFVFAGKAHPQDSGSKVILQQIARWKREPAIMQRAVFLQDYDQEIARQLVHSVDVWMNVPRRPLEASGTSGQKVGMNGGLNMSVLDGWWIEGYEETPVANGWSIGRADAAPPAELGDASQMESESQSQGGSREDREDAESLYRVIEEQVVPCFYDDRDANGIPTKWVAMMRRSIETLSPAFNSDRMVQDYAREIYTG